MGNFVRFLDAVDLKAPEVSQELRDVYANATEKNVRPLRIRIAATHAGKITRNNGFYLPHKMEQGASTFTDQYAKPIQVHHEERQDPIGRVVAAKYVDISASFLKRDHAEEISEKSLSDFLVGEGDEETLEDFANSVVIQDITVSNDPDYEGLGYVEIIADITDPDAIQKILDGRYLTGSVGASTNRAVCSVCKQDWAAKGKCKHRPGKSYEEKKCVLIAGDLKYDEYSFVNKPADRHSRVIEISTNGIQDFVELDRQPDVILAANLHIQSEEDKNMLFKDALERVSKVDFFKEVENLEDAVKAVIDSDELSDESKEKDLERCVAMKLDKCEAYDKAFPPDTQEAPLPVETFWGDEYEDIVGDDKWGREYAEMLFDLVQETDEADREAVEQMVRDAKLSAAQRKKLSGSTFCGPERSFPVNDCAHYTAALRLIGRYKGPGDKSRIRACIERKGKRLGCGSKSKKDETEANQFSLDYFDHFSDEELQQMSAGLMGAMIERELVPDLTEGGQHQDVTEAVAEAKAEAATQAEKDRAQTEDRLAAARKEIHYLHGDIENLTNTMADVIESARKARVSHVLHLHQLVKKDVDVQAVTDELHEKSKDEIEEMFKDLSNQVDMLKIVDTLNSGLSNNPTGTTVEDPTLKVDNTAGSEEDEVIEISDAFRETLKLEWLRVRAQYGQDVADKWLDRTCKQHKINIKDVSAEEQS
jgi:hypothetical protein